MAKKTEPKNTTPAEKVAKKKRAVIIANAKYDDFRKEYDRTKEQYAKHYPGGVEFVDAYGYNELKNAFGKVDPDEDLIMMAHHNADAMYGIPVSDPTFRTFDAPEGKTLATLFKSLEDKGYQGNCYLGICKGEETAKSLQGAGVNIPIFSTPEGNKWYGSNTAAKGDFEDFFFGVGKRIEKPKSEYDAEGWASYVTQNPDTIDPEIGKDYLMNISPRQQELMNRRKSGTPVTEVAPLKKKKGGKLPSYDVGGTLLESVPNLIQGVQMLGQQRKNKKQAEQFKQLSAIVGQAAGIVPDQPKRRYIRPEDMLIEPDQLAPSYGTGTNFLAKNGKKLPSYNPGGWITDITGEGNEGDVGNMLGSIIGGGRGQMSGAGKIGSTVGGIAGSFLGPIGGAAGSAIGGLIGGAIGGNAQKQAEKDQQQAYMNLQNAAFQQGTRGLHNQNSAFMNYGGKLPSYNMGGELQVYRGDAETISQNPYLPDGGETVLFQGPSHEKGGMPVKFGKTTVEVEGGEPAVKLEQGSKGNDNLVIFGDMKIPSYGISELNDPKAKGKKFKTYIKGLSKIEDKQNKVIDKGLNIINETKVIDSFDKLKFSSGKALLEGGNMKLKDIAQKKRTAASIQDAILQTADELGLKSDELAKGNIKKAKKGSTLKAKDGLPGIDPIKPFALSPNLPQLLNLQLEGGTPVPTSPTGIDAPPSPASTPPSTEEEGNKANWMNIVNSVLPYLRPSNQNALDPNQLSGEMFALATNQLEPVQAQTYQPLLEQTSNISLQDQLNANQADFNAIQRATRNNPAAQATLAAQKYAANASVLGEQFRLNQAQQLGTQNRNRTTLNDATLKNLAILDNQYTRQSQAKSATKATAQAALSSIADKIAKNKLENRTLGIYENLYNYRFGPQGQAFNMNPLANFNIPEVGSLTPIAGEPKMTEREWETTRKDALGMPKGSTSGKMTTTKTTQRNGGIVKALKSL